MSANESNSSVVDNIGWAVQEGGHILDVVLNDIALVFEFLLLVAILAALFVFRKPLWRSTKSCVQKTRDKCRLRQLKRCFLYTFCCGCCRSVHGVLGFDKLDHRSTLTVTFICAQEVKRMLNFYFEAWSEPQESTGKNTGSFSGTDIVDMGLERLEFEWFGDEDELVIQLCEFKSTVMCYNTILGQLRIPGSVVDKYAKEVETNPNDFNSGVRSFDVRPLDAEEKRRQAELRKKHVNKREELMKAGVDMVVQSKFGNSAELNTLREENARLRQEMTLLGGTTQPSNTECPPETLLKVILRFEIRSSKEQISDLDVRRCSFDEASEQNAG
eukprot:TRINITY_DN1142_c0_g2_i1.p1 TRINITY_DN1142_c0_g2~~TRINITY_DN1142_c0_g2_i1.p1  ORF type:complete len:350 (-),score=53.12 TRINITY_DN1142_c0_g2_i1:174-1160(-)